MLVKFRTRVTGPVTMFGNVAIELIKLMGHRGSVPGAIGSEDVAAALQRLEDALDEMDVDKSETSADDREEPGEFIDQPVNLRTRAFPLIELLEAAIAEDVGIMWE